MKISTALQQKYSQKREIIYFDFDGTLADYKGDFKEGQTGKPLEGVIEGLKELKNSGFDIGIYTARNTEADRVGIEEWIKSNNLTGIITDVKLGKPHWFLLVDDKAMNFDGKLDINSIKKFKAWWKNEN